MTDRDLFNAIMHYGEFDRVPSYHWANWVELDKEWHEQHGMPLERDAQAAWFGRPPLPRRPHAHISLFPGFEQEVLEETDDYRIVRDSAGVVLQDWKNKSCIPHFIEHTLKDRATWEEHFKWRLQPDPKRVDERTWRFVDEAKDRDWPAAVTTGSMIGWTRNWMGVEGLSYLAADDPDLIGEIADTLAELAIATLEPVVATMDPAPDLGWFWEDICCKSGPLVSPRIFEQYCTPAYKKITDMLKRYGTDVSLVDCDGVIDALVPGWLAGGVNIMFPIEIGVWQADPMAFRRQYGKELRIFGGIDKGVLYHGPEAIDAEIARRIPLMKDGGFIPLPDHLIPPGVPIENYKYYLQAIADLRF